MAGFGMPAIRVTKSTGEARIGKGDEGDQVGRLTGGGGRRRRPDFKEDGGSRPWWLALFLQGGGALASYRFN
jgi:hypothetical protein